MKLIAACIFYLIQISRSSICVIAFKVYWPSLLVFLYLF